MNGSNRTQNAGREKQDAKQNAGTNGAERPAGTNGANGTKAMERTTRSEEQTVGRRTEDDKRKAQANAIGMEAERRTRSSTGSSINGATQDGRQSRAQDGKQDEKKI